MQIPHWILGDSVTAWPACIDTWVIDCGCQAWYWSRLYSAFFLSFFFFPSIFYIFFLGDVGFETLTHCWAAVVSSCFPRGVFLCFQPTPLPPIILPSGDLWSRVASWPGRRNGHDVVLFVQDGRDLQVDSKTQREKADVKGEKETANVPSEVSLF